MKCVKCGKKISEFETYCENCKHDIELSKLIEDNKKLNELDDTKELPNLKELVKDFAPPEDINFKNNSSKPIIIILISLIVVLVGVIVVLLILKDKPNEDKAEEVINYEEIIKQYGRSVEINSKSYLKNQNKIPSWQEVSKLESSEYEIVCYIHNIYSDGSIYLNDCKVNGKGVNYSYGIEKQEVKEGKKISIYRNTISSGDYNYLDYKEEESNVVGSITCMSDKCKFILAREKYVIIKELDGYYVYNYEKDNIEFGPFKLDEDNINTNLLIDTNKLYGIYYTENEKNYLYNLSTGKTLKNLTGKLYYNEFNDNYLVIYNYNYVILENNLVYNFINLNTGNTSYSIKEELGSFIEDKKNNLVYFITYDTEDHSEFKIYNSHGKSLFNGEKYKLFSVTNNGLIVATANTFKVYDSNLKLNKQSKEYDEVLGIFKDFIVVLDNNKLEIVDYKDKILNTFDFEWDDKYYFHTMLSGTVNEDNVEKINLIVEDTNIPFGTLGSGITLYYIPSTGISGITKTTGIK